MPGEHVAGSRSAGQRWQFGRVELDQALVHDLGGNFAVESCTRDDQAGRETCSGGSRDDELVREWASQVGVVVGGESVAADVEEDQLVEPERLRCGRHLLGHPDGAAEPPAATIRLRTSQLPGPRSRVWRKARVRALSAEDAASPLARRPYDLRHTAVSTWLNAGVPSTQVAEWAGHSVAVLHQIYAKCIVGQDEAARLRIDTALGGGK
jgi:hypothetical protein